MHYPVLFCLPYPLPICLPCPLSNCLPDSVVNCFPYLVVNCFPYPVGIGTVEVQRGTKRCSEVQRSVTNVVPLQRKSKFLELTSGRVDKWTSGWNVNREKNLEEYGGRALLLCFRYELLTPKVGTGTGTKTKT